jgi:deazaflavin-dependent oxidoreductase (nitroreductase family)
MSTQTLVPHVIRSPHVKRPTLLSDRRSRLARLLFRSPIWLYRLGLGWIFGHQFLLLTHAGRRTGRIRETVLKVLQYDPLTRETIVASAWGEQTDWYRNIQARGRFVCSDRKRVVRSTPTDTFAGRSGGRFRRLDTPPALVCAVDAGSNWPAARRDGARGPRCPFPLYRVQPLG